MNVFLLRQNGSSTRSWIWVALMMIAVLTSSGVSQAAGTILPPLRPVTQQVGSMQGLLGVELAARGQLLSAEPLLEQAITSLPQDLDLLTVYGMVLDGLDRQDKAQQLWHRVLTLDHNNIQAYYGLARIEERQKQLERAAYYLGQAVRIAPNNAQLHYDLGVLYATMNAFKPSAIHTREAVDLGLRSAESLNNYGYALAHTGETVEAMRAVDESLKLEPQSAATLDSKGFVYYRQGDWRQALIWYDKALAADPTIGEVYLHRAQALEKLDQSQQAITAYRTYLQLTPLAADKATVLATITRLERGRPALGNATTATPPLETETDTGSGRRSPASSVTVTQ